MWTINNRSSALLKNKDNGWIQNNFDKDFKTQKMDDLENGRSKGSILADNMGLGKNPTTLALIWVTSSQGKSFQQAETNHPSCSTPDIFSSLTLSHWETQD